MITVFLGHESGKKAVLVGLSAADIKEMQTGAMKTATLEEIDITDRKLVFLYAGNMIEITPVTEEAKRDITILMRDDFIAQMTKLPGLYCYEDTSVAPFTIMIAIKDTDEELRIAIESFFRKNSIPNRDDSPTGRCRPSLN